MIWLTHTRAQLLAIMLENCSATVAARHTKTVPRLLRALTVASGWVEDRVPTLGTRSLSPDLVPKMQEVWDLGWPNQNGGTRVYWGGWSDNVFHTLESTKTLTITACGAFAI